jgi:ketosteroid isomerase-like protein
MTDAMNATTKLWNEGRFDAFLEWFSDDAVLVLPEGIFHGKKEIRDYWEWNKSFWPDRRLMTSSVLVTEDGFAEEYLVEGTFSAPLTMPDGTVFEPNGAHLSLKGMNLIHVRDGKIVSHHIYYDRLELMVQMGILPPPPSLTPTP